MRRAFIFVLFLATSCTEDIIPVNMIIINDHAGKLKSISLYDYDEESTDSLEFKWTYQIYYNEEGKIEYIKNQDSTIVAIVDYPNGSSINCKWISEDFTEEWNIITRNDSLIELSIEQNRDELGTLYPAYSPTNNIDTLYEPNIVYAFSISNYDYEFAGGNCIKHKFEYYDLLFDQPVGSYEYTYTPYLNSQYVPHQFNYFRRGYVNLGPYDPLYFLSLNEIKALPSNTNLLMSDGIIEYDYRINDIGQVDTVMHKKMEDANYAIEILKYY